MARKTIIQQYIIRPNFKIINLSSGIEIIPIKQARAYDIESTGLIKYGDDNKFPTTADTIPVYNHNPLEAEGGIILSNAK
jgi:hypothetical protein